MKHPLLAGLEQHAAHKLAGIGDPPCGCVVLLGVELVSAVAALEGVGVEGAIDVGGQRLNIGRGCGSLRPNPITNPETTMALSPTEAKPKLSPEHLITAAATEKLIDAALPSREGPSITFNTRAEVPEGADEKLELGVLPYAVFLEVVARYRGKGWHCYSSWAGGVGTLQLVAAGE